MVGAVKKGKLKGYEGAMKKLLKPYTVSIEVNSLSSISNEQWISVLYRLDKNGAIEQSENRLDPEKSVTEYADEFSKDTLSEASEPQSVCPETATYVAAFERTLKNNENSLQNTTNTEDFIKSQPPPNDDDIYTPIRLIIEFADSEEDSRDLQGAIIKASVFPLHRQLTALFTDTDIQRNEALSHLFSDQSAATKFQSVLIMFHDQSAKINDISPFQWDGKQIALSFMMHSVNRMINEQTINDEMGSIWEFIHFLRRFCIEEQWNGIKLKDFWNETTEKGVKMNEFGVALTDKVRSHFEPDCKPFTESMELLPVWYNAELNRAETHPAVLSDCTVEDIVSLLTFDATGDGKEAELNDDHADGVLSVFESPAEDGNECVTGIKRWRQKIVHWVLSDDVNGEALLDDAYVQDMSFELAAVLIPSDMKGSEKRKMKRKLQEQCCVILNLIKKANVYNVFRGIAVQNANSEFTIKSVLGDDDQPLIGNQVWSVIGRWIRNDSHYNRCLDELKRLFKKYDISGGVMSLISLEREEDFVQIENILKKDMKQYLSIDTMTLIIDSTRKWLSDVHERFLRLATTDDMAELVIDFPLRNLKIAISDKEIDCEQVMRSPRDLVNIVKTATGWTQSECKQITDVVLRQCSFTKNQILQNVQDIGRKNGLSQMVIEKMKNTLSECELNLEDVHYRLRTKAIMDRQFGALLLNLLEDLSADKHLLDLGVINEEFNSIYFSTLASAMIVMAETEWGRGHAPWQCVCCGNLNVHKNIDYTVVVDIPICSLCGVTQIEGITMAIKGINMPFQAENLKLMVPADEANEDYKNEVGDDDSISKHIKNKELDLHCMTQKDAGLCPELRVIANAMIEQRRYIMMMEGEGKDREKNLTADDLRESVTVEEYKETFLKSVSEVMAKTQPDDIESVIETLTEMFNDKEEEICDFAPYFAGGKHKAMINILMERTKMTKKTANKVRLSAKQELLNMALSRSSTRYQEWLKQIAEQIERAKKHIDRYHLEHEFSSKPRQMAVHSFFESVLHFEDNQDKRLRYLQMTKAAMQQNCGRVDGLLHSLYLKLCHTDDKAVGIQASITQSADGGDSESDEKVNIDKYVHYSFGVRPVYCSVSPKFDCTREEMQCNAECPESHTNFVSILKKAIQVFCDDAKRDSVFTVAQFYGSKHGILRNQTVTVKHVFSVLSYTDLSKFGPIFQCPGY